MFEALRLLHKVALTIAKFGMRADDVAWWIEARTPRSGWIAAGDFPIDATTLVPIDAWVAMQAVLLVARRPPKGRPDGARKWASTAADAATSSTDNITDLAALTGWEAADITAMAGAFHWVDAGAAFDEIKKELRKPANLERLRTRYSCGGWSKARAIDWGTPEPGVTEAESLKQTVKASLRPRVASGSS